MSAKNTLWMGDIEPWMTEQIIINSFQYFNLYPINVKLIKDKKKNINRTYCFITFKNIEDAVNALCNLNGKKLPFPSTNIIFKLNWADYQIVSTKTIYVGNLNSKVGDSELYNLFSQKYKSVHHANVISENGVSKRYGFVIFKNEEDYLRSLKEMNGFNFYGNNIKVREQRKKEDDNKNNDETKNRKKENNNNNLNGNINKNNLYSNNNSRDNYNYIYQNNFNINNNIQNNNFINNLKFQNNLLNSNTYNKMNKDNINLNNNNNNFVNSNIIENKFNDRNDENEKNDINNYLNNTKINKFNISPSLDNLFNKKSTSISICQNNSNFLNYQNNENNDNKILSESLYTQSTKDNYFFKNGHKNISNSDNPKLNMNTINNSYINNKNKNNFKNENNNKNYKTNNKKNNKNKNNIVKNNINNNKNYENNIYRLEVLDSLDEVTLFKKIHESIQRTFEYQKKLFINNGIKFKSKHILINYIFYFYIVSDMFIYYCPESLENNYEFVN